MNHERVAVAAFRATCNPNLLNLTRLCPLHEQRKGKKKQKKKRSIKIEENKEYITKKKIPSPLELSVADFFRGLLVVRYFASYQGGALSLGRSIRAVLIG